MIQLPYGVKAKLPTEKTFEKLFQALADTKATPSLPPPQLEL